MPIIEQEQAMKLNAPSQISISIEGFYRDSYLLVYSFNKLRYMTYDPQGLPSEQIVTPSQEDWNAFLTELNAIGVWSWRKSYWNSSICDGTQWRVSIKWGKLKCVSDGSNIYPNEDGSPSQGSEPTPVFLRFLKAVSRLAGGRAFE